MSIESRSRQYGKIAGHWQIREFLGSGSGGKSAVFRLVHTDSGSVESALKVVNLIEKRGDLDSLTESRKAEYERVKQESKDFAEQEVLLMNKLQGRTNVVTYSDHTFVDWADETGFGCDLLIRMELLTDLRTEIEAEHRFDQDDILKIGRDICTALVLCHSKNILHRDIKPENIFVNEDGNYKLGDFGVSRILSAAPMSKASTSVCTPEYAAPEQLSGKYDKRVDIYSLGLVLYELSNGNLLPFAASSYITDVEVQKRMLGTPMPAPCNASKSFAAVILKACAYNPEDRYQTAEDFLAELNYLSGIAPRPAVEVSSGARGTQKAAPAVGGNETQYAGLDTSKWKGSRETVYANPGERKTPDDQPPKEPKKRFPKGIMAGIAAVLVCVLFFFLREEHEHAWTDATCTASRTCEECGETEGSALGHNWVEATCTAPRICNVCQKIEGTALGHQWMDATYETPQTCNVCGATEGSVKSPSSSLGLRDIISSAQASSVYSGDYLGTHGPEKMYDGQLDTNWTENASGNGIGEYVTFYFDDIYAVKKLRIYIGSHFNEGVYKQNCRPKVIILTFSDGSTERISLEDSYDEQVITFDQYHYTDYVKLSIDDVYTGTKYLDTVIAELDFVAYRP